MCPSLALNYQRDCGPCNAEPGRNLGMSHTGSCQYADLAHVVVCESGAGVFGAKCLALPADHIRHVLLVAANNQVTGVNTTGVVAFMANDRTGRYGAIVQFVAEAVGEYLARALVALAADAKHAVPVMALCPSPQPTGIGRSLHYLLPKAFGDRAAGLQAIVVSPGKVALRGPDYSAAPAGADDCAGKGVSARIMAAYILSRLALDVAVRFAVSRGGFGLLSTTTVAVTVRNFLWIALDGMLTHVVSPSKAFGHATGRLLRRGGAFCLTTGVL